MSFMSPTRHHPHFLPILVLLGAVLGFFLFTEHRAHLFGFLPFGLLLLCPLMHLFMRHGHGRGGRHEGPGGETKP